MGKIRKKFYAVRVGRNTGIYNSWSECEAQVKQYPGAIYKSFGKYEEANTFVNTAGGYSTTRKASSRGRGNSTSKSSHVSSTRERYAGNFTSRYFSSIGSSDGSSGPPPPPPLPSPSLSSSSSLHSSGGQYPVVYSDGCCFNNGYVGARAGIGVFWEEGSSNNISEKLGGHQTNQRAEIMSACRAIQSAIQQGFSSVEVRTDSTYTIKAATEWIDKWKKNGWHTADKGDVKNKPDMLLLDALCQSVDVKWTHVRGHVGIPGNEAADALAKAGSMKPLDQ